MKTLYSYCKGFGVFFLLSLISFQMNAQDIHFSQFGNSPLNHSPALTGMFGGDVRLIGNYRSQWNTVPVSYLTFSGSVDAKLDKFCSNHDQWAGGLIFNYDVAGDSKLHTAQLGLNVSYTHQLTASNYLTLGVQLSGYERGFSTRDLRFDEQFDGRWYNGGLPNGENFTNTSVIYGDFALGLNYRFQKPRTHTTWNPQNRTKVDIGGGIFHINRPDKSFWEDPNYDEAKQEIRYSVYGLGTFRLLDPLDLVLVGLYQKQGPHQETVLGFGGKIHLNQKRTKQTNLLLGLNFRLDDAIIPNIEFQYNAWKVGLSYDINTSEFQIATDRFGGPEFSVVYIFVKPRLDSFKNCNPIY